MEDMALGYGSEYQLLRYLGHHRNYLNKIIQGETHSESPIEWMDYPVNNTRISKDGEWTGVEFVKHLKTTLPLDYNKIKKDWNAFWPTRGSQQSWDGIFVQDKTIYIVEAKAHLEEMKSTPCEAKDKVSLAKIKKALATVTKDTKIAESLMKSNLYQFVNRIAFVHFLKEHGITARLCYIFFLNDTHWSYAVKDRREYEDEFERECNILKLYPNQKKDIINVFVDTEKDGFGK